MQTDFSLKLLEKYKDFKIVWKLISEEVSDECTRRLYEAPSPIKGRMCHHEVIENSRGSFGHTWID